MRNVYLLLFAAAFYPRSGFSQAFTNGTISSGGQLRSYRIFVPSGYTGQEAVPLVLNLHAQPSNAVEAEAWTRFSEVADTAGFILVYPVGSPYPQSAGDFYWNVYGSGADDVGFISNLLDNISAQYNIDQNRIYATGFSNGSAMCYELACQLSHRIAAIASVSGTVFKSHLQSCHPPRPVPVLHIHGTDDQTAPYNGGAVPGNGAFAAADSLVRFWVNHNDCSPVPVVTSLPDLSTTDGCTAEHYLFSGGTAESTVEFFKIIDGGHTWPSGFVNGFDHTNEDIHASREIWRFFSPYRLNELVTTQEADILNWSVYPNPASGFVTVQTDGSVASGRIDIADLFGRCRKSVPFSTTGDAIQLDINELPGGVYFIRFRTEKGYGCRQLIKQ